MQKFATRLLLAAFLLCCSSTSVLADGGSPIPLCGSVKCPGQPGSPLMTLFDDGSPIPLCGPVKCPGLPGSNRSIGLNEVQSLSDAQKS
jgi:hypothetical protein